MDKSDHTCEVEKRLVAIKIKESDGCAFFKKKDGTIAPLKQCWYCCHSDFTGDKSLSKEYGLCKFKRK